MSVFPWVGLGALVLFLAWGINKALKNGLESKRAAESLEAELEARIDAESRPNRVSQLLRSSLNANNN